MKYRIFGIGMTAVMLLAVAVISFYTPENPSRRVHQHLTARGPDEGCGCDGTELCTHLPLVIIDTGGQTIPGEDTGLDDGYGEAIYTLAEDGRDVVDVHISIIDNQDRNNHPSDPTAVETLTEIRLRGHSSRHFEKAPYLLNFVDENGEGRDLEVMGMSAHSDWALYGPYLDKTLIRNYLWYNLSGEIMEWAPNVRYCELILDGEYRGLYELSEKNSVGGTSVDITDLEEAYEALNPSYGEDMNTATGTNAYGQTIQFTTGLKDPADITGGYLIELNHDYWDEASGFATKQGVAFNVKSPEWASEAAIRYISEYYQGFEDAVYAVDADGNYTGYNEATGKYYYDYVDQESLVKLVLLQQLALNPDGFISSVYFYKDVDGKMYAGPIWDQDMTLGTGWSKYIDPSIVDYHYLEEALLRIPGFKKAVTDYYHSVFAPMVAETIADGGTVDQYADVLAENMAMNHVLWPFIRIGSPSASGHVWENTTYDEVIRDTKQWLADRLEVLDGIFVASGDVTGDVNGDGKADSDDAVLILRHLAGYEVTGNIAAGDVNGDGRADSDDAVLILRRLAGYVD